MHCPQGVTYCTVVNWVIPGNTERHKRPHKSKENRNVLFFFCWSVTWFIKQYNLCSTNMFGIMLRLKWSSLRLNTRLAWSILWQSAKTVFVDYFLFSKKPEIKYAAKILFYAFSFVPRYLTYCPLIWTNFPSRGLDVSWKHICQKPDEYLPSAFSNT